MKSVLISIQPKWVEKIAIGDKTIEVRKTRPKIETPFKCYIYETKDNKYKNRGILGYRKDGTYCDFKHRIGKVIGEFVCDNIDEYLCKDYDWGDDVSLEYHISSKEGHKTCLEYDEIKEYGNEKPIYFWHISDLKIYNKPKELSEFWTIKCTNKRNGCLGCEVKPNCIKDIARPPQSWCYVESLGE